MQADRGTEPSTLMGGGNTRLDQQPAVLRGTESLLTLCCREVDSNFQYAGTGESRHSSFVVPDCLGRASLPPVRNRWFADSLVEEAGCELEVPLARKDGSRGERGRRAIKVASKGLSLSRGTSGSKPSPSSGESGEMRRYGQAMAT